MQEALTAYLQADTALVALVMDRIHWGRLPATVSGRPYINLSVVSEPGQYHFGGRSNYNETRLQADVWAESAADALAVKRALRARIEAKRFTAGDTRFQGVFVDGERDLDSETAGAVAPLFGKSIDFMIHWAQEA